MQRIYNEIAATATLASPVIMAELAQVAMGFIDTVMVGRLGTIPLAACALGNAIYLPLLVVFVGLLSAVSPMVSQAFGGKTFDEISAVVNQGLWLALFLGLPLMLLSYFSGNILLRMNYNAEVASLASDYMRAMSFGAIPALMYAVLRNYIEAISKPLPIMVITLLGLVLNVGANYVLMFGKLGFPALGVAGVGWATALVFAFMFVALIICIEFRPMLRRFWALRYVERLRTSGLREILELGWPIGLMLGVQFGLFGFSGMVIAYFDAAQLAAHQIAIQTVSVFYMIPVGLSIATAVRVGQHVGAGSAEQARLSGCVGIGLSVIVMLLPSVLFWIAPQSIIGLYLDVSDPANAEIVSYATVFLGIAALFQVVDGVKITSAGALRGLKDTRGPMTIAVFSYWGVGAVVGLLIALVAEWEGEGMWWGLATGLTTASVLLLRRFERYSKNLSDWKT